MQWLHQTKVGKKVAIRKELLSLLQELDMKRKQNSDLAPNLKTSSPKVSLKSLQNFQAALNHFSLANP